MNLPILSLLIHPVTFTVHLVQSHSNKSFLIPHRLTEDYRQTYKIIKKPNQIPEINVTLPLKVTLSNGIHNDTHNESSFN